MSNNMTRKGLAFGAGFALVASGFAALPANAEGIEDGITLAPEDGKDYAVLVDQNFDLEANFANSVEDDGEYLKFYVDDPFERASVVDPGTSLYEATASSSAEINTGDKIVLTFSSGHNFENGDKVNVSGATGTDLALVNTTAAAEITVSGNTITYDSEGTTSADGALTLTLQPTVTLDNTTFARSTTADATLNDFVVDTRSDNNSSAKDLSLSVSGTTTHSIKVTAWVDTNDNGVIDATENRSPERTVHFVDPGDLDVSTSLVQPIVGDDALEARVTFSPTLNGPQVLTQDPNFVNAEFMRQDSALKLYAEDTQSAPGTTSNWNALGKYFSVAVPLDADPTANDSDTEEGLTDQMDGTSREAWDDIDRPLEAVESDGARNTDGEPEGVLVAVSATNVATATVQIADGASGTAVEARDHNLRVGDKVTFGGGSDALLDGNEFTVTAVPSATTFQFALDNNETADTSVGTATDNRYTVTTYAQTNTDNVSIADRVFPGTYSAQAVIDDDGFKLAGAKSTLGTVAVTSDDVIVSTTASENVQGAVVATDSQTVVQVKEDTTEVVVTFAVVDEDDDPVTAGRPVVIEVESETAGILVNGGTADLTLTTDSNGQVSVTVTDTTGSTSSEVELSATPEGQASATGSIKLDWIAQSYSLVDLNSTGATLGDTTRTMMADSSYDLELAIMDQWFTPADSDTYRIRVSGDGVSQGIQTLVDGRTTVTITDTGAFDAADTFTSTIDVQKLSSGVWADTSSDADITNNLVAGGTVALGADGSTLYQPGGSSKAVDLSDAVSTKAIVAIDDRTESTLKPAYDSDLVIQGKVIDGSTSAALAGAAVTISGPNSILFENAEVSSRGELTLFADSNGEFEVVLYSTTGQEDTEISVTSLGDTETVDVTFTGRGAGEATNLTIDAPSFVAPASSLQIKAMLTDDFGTAVADTVKVTYTGPGIVFGDLPTATDTDGELSFTALLGANDTGNITVTVSYDQNGDGDYSDDKDLVTTKTITIGDAPAAQKVNAGSFKGYVAVYALGYEGQRLSAKIGNDWVIVDPIVNNESANLARVTDFTGAGVDISVRIYIDRVLEATIPLTTK